MAKIYVITGCSTEDSLGYEIAVAIRKNEPDCKIIAIANENDCDYGMLDGAVSSIVTCDLTKDYKESIGFIKFANEKIDCLINCAGVNKNEWFENVSEESWDITMDVNAKSMYQISQFLLSELIAAKGTILNIVSNASHVPMTGSLCYNASKAASKMVSMQMAHELTRKHNITVFSISPNKLDGTKMTNKIDEQVPEVRGWSREDSDKYQNDSLKTGKKTDPKVLAEFIAFLLSTKERHFYLSGCDIPYGA